MRSEADSGNARRAGALDLSRPGWGGKRAGAGRKPVMGRPGVSHGKRAPVNPEHPLHITLSMTIHSLRKQRVFETICQTFKEVNRERGEEFRIVHFSVQANHIHLLVEAQSNQALSGAMQSLNLRLHYRLNKLLRRKGSLLRDRFHDRELTSARAVKHVLAYVFANFIKHNTREARLGFAMDPYSSAIYFDGFAAADDTTPYSMGWLSAARDSATGDTPLEDAPPVARARSKLLSYGWKREGLLSVCHRQSRW